MGSMKKVDLIGKIVNTNILVISFHGFKTVATKIRHKLWKCRCLLCNKIFIASTQSINKRKSCGCLTTYLDVSGQRFGRLIAIKSHKNPKVRHKDTYYWECQCDCGKNTLVSIGNLRSGAVKSCGCLSRDTNQIEPGKAAANRVFATYKQGAKVRKIQFKITFEDFIRLTNKICNYCGCKPGTIQKGRNGSFIYNGLDRVNSTIGYTLDNVVPCCIQCNRAKHTMTVEEFYNFIKRVYNYLVDSSKISVD